MRVRFHEAYEKIKDALEGLRDEEIVEIGVMVAAKGVFRVRENSGHEKAAKAAASVATTFRDTAIDCQRRRSP